MLNSLCFAAPPGCSLDFSIGFKVLAAQLALGTEFAKIYAQRLASRRTSEPQTRVAGREAPMLSLETARNSHDASGHATVDRVAASYCVLPRLHHRIEIRRAHVVTGPSLAALLFRTRKELET